MMKKIAQIIREFKEYAKENHAIGIQTMPVKYHDHTGVKFIHCESDSQKEKIKTFCQNYSRPLGLARETPTTLIYVL